MACGAARTRTPRTSRTRATPYVAILRHGRTFSIVMRPATTAIHTRVIRAYRATVGATEGNIIAAIITTHTARNQPNVPRPAHGPWSIPRIRPHVHHQPSAAMAKSSATSPSRARAAARAGARPPARSARSVRTRSGAGAITFGSGCPGELGGGDARPSLVGDPERVD